MKRTSARRFTQVALIVAGAGAVAASGVGIARLLSLGDLLGSALVAGGFLVAAGTLWTLAEVLANHFRTLDRLRGLAIGMREAAGAPEAFDAPDAETAALADAVLATIAARMAERATPDDRLAAVLAGVRDAVIAVTDQGQVSLVNGLAKALLGGEQMTVGTSIYDSLAREPLAKAFRGARLSGAPVAVRLATVDGRMHDGTVADMGRFRGYIISLSGAAAATTGVLEHDLSLHDRPPAAAPADDATRLAELPVTILDTETTGLDPARDRIVALGAVRMHGARLFRAASLDLLVNPGVTIPPASTLVHGISDAMVADAPQWPAQAERLRAIWAGTIVVGHNVGFDLAMLRAEAERFAIAWSDPAALDIVQLTAVLEPAEHAFDLEQIAARLGVESQGRHTALGDCLIAASIWQRLIPRLAERGVATLGEAKAFAARASRIVARQRAAGW